ncbi:MAG TPA: M14 family zinc carboxypeptidase [Longimicrobiales bacterium]|nr:M14 family zinc carboxypeptidase [Longimicrobiales bacterium]
MKHARSIVLSALVLWAASPAAAAAQQTPIPSPEDFFGHVMGADRRLARWDQLVEYYRLIDRESDRVQVVEMGPSTLGNPFLSIFVSSPENLADLDRIKARNAVLSDPRDHTEAEVEDAIENGRVVFVQSYGLHSSEVSPSQTAAEVVYDFATRNDEEMVEILENTVSILIPVFNPDGNILVTDWYNETVGTEYEGAGLPVLYHHYIGHDNNRDAFMQNTVESRYGAEILFREWVPQGYIDHHQMGAYTARISLPPYAEPIRPDGDPLVWREMAWYGAHMAYKMDEADLPGAIGAAIYSGWGHFGFHWITPFHNIAGMLTESASARLASPLYVHPDQLQGSRQFPEYEAQTTYPNPWEGGWWRVRDMVVRQKVATFAPLDIAAKNRETVLRNAYLKASRQTQRGAEGETRAFVVPAEQHDPGTMLKMVDKLLLQGIDVRRSDAGFTHEGRVYGPGTYVVDMAQPKRGVIRWLLGRTFYPDNTYTRDRDGDPIRPYDMSTDNLAEFMGVRVDPVGSMVEASLVRVTGTPSPPAEVAAAGAYGWRIDGRSNDAFEAVNLLQAEGTPVSRVAHASGALRPGDFVVPARVPADVVQAAAAEAGVAVAALDDDPAEVAYPLQPQRIGMFQRYYGGNMDEGWTRWLLEDFSFPYTSVLSDEIRRGDLASSYDVIILPQDGVQMMTGEFAESGEYQSFSPEDWPEEYRSGFGQEGIAALEAFVRAGGTLVTFATAGDLPMQHFGIPVRNAVEGLSSTEFWSPGSTLHVEVDAEHPVAYGMPDRALAVFWQGNQVYETIPGAESAGVERIATFVDRDVLRSGWLLGEDAIAGKAAAVSVSLGEGRVVMLGFRAQHRAQTHGTFKLVFNALMSGPPAHEAMATQEQGGGS